MKGNIGHTEAASGVASLIKTTLMMDRGVIPKLASHNTLNPKIPSLETHHMMIPRELTPWKAPFKAALVNNYGAAGSNGAMVVCQPPIRKTKHTALKKVPVLVSALSAQSLVAGSKFIQKQLQKIFSEATSDVAFNMLDKFQHFSEHAIAGTATTTSDIIDLLNSPQPNCKSSAKPVVLVFGGQTRDHVGLDWEMIDKVSLFRRHLNAAITAIHAAGLDLKISDICQRSAVEDVVKLHCMFFAAQYACGKSWMAAGLKVDAVIGHSFGQLTALCISGRLSLKDTIKIIAGRASLIKKLWGAEHGSMISLEASVETASKIVDMVAQSNSGHRVEIACFNGPTSHVLVGTAGSIEYVTRLLAEETATLGTVRNRVLKVTHGFHSEFTEPLLPELARIAEDVTFHHGSILLETCSEGSTWDEITSGHIVEHTRSAVHFGAAVERLAGKLGPCTWLEAGGDSSVTGMVRRVFDAEARQQHTFHAIRLAGDDTLDHLADSTVELWKAGQKVQFWPFHRIQRKCFTPISLPPYQFEKTRHWLEWKEATAPVSTPTPTAIVATAPELLTLVSGSNNDAVFRINPKCEEFQLLVRGHAVLDSPLCPADWYTEIAYRALGKLANATPPKAIKRFTNLAFHSPLGVNPKGEITLILRRSNEGHDAWTFAFSTPVPKKSIEHCTGDIVLTSANDTAIQSEMARYETLVGLGRPMALLQDPSATGLRGSLIYQLFSRVVNYADYYQAVKAVCAVGDEVAAQIVLPARNALIMNKKLSGPIAVDNFVQVAGIKVNCLNQWSPSQVYICGHIGRIQESSEFDPETQHSWTVYAHSRAVSDKSYMNDIYVFTEGGRLAMVIQDVEFTRVAIASLTRVLTAANAETTPQVPPQKGVTASRGMPARKPSLSFPPPAMQVSAALEGVVDNLLRLRQLVSKVTDVPLAAIKPDSTLDGLGVDSLMNTEVLNAVQDEFDVKIPVDKFGDLQDVRAISEYLSRNSQTASASEGSSRMRSAHVMQIPTPGLETPSESDAQSTGPSSVQGDDDASPQSDTFNRLSQLVAELLDVTDAVSPEAALEDLGMDSLLSIELCSAIEKEFKMKSEEIVTTGSLIELWESIAKKTKTAPLTLGSSLQTPRW